MIDFDIREEGNGLPRTPRENATDRLRLFCDAAELSNYNTYKFSIIENLFFLAVYEELLYWGNGSYCIGVE